MSWTEERARRWLHALPPDHLRAVQAWAESDEARQFLGAIAEHALERTVRLGEEIPAYAV